jgi:quercetin dioxygenase-like cupin family protein
MGEEAITSGRQKALGEATMLLDVAIARPRGSSLLYGRTKELIRGCRKAAKEEFGQLAEPYGAANGCNARGGITDMRDEKSYSLEDSLEICRPVQAFDAASAAKRLREEKTYEDYGRSVLSLFSGPSLRATLTDIATGRRTGERRVAGPSTVHVLEGEVRFQAGEERHVLSAGGTLILEGNVSYEAEALSDAAFLHTLVWLAEEEKSLPRSAHLTEPAEGRVDLDLPGADHAS